MRILTVSFLLLVGLWPAQASASTYYVDLSTVPIIDTIVGPCYCGQGPLFAFYPFPSVVKAGDFINFGQVEIFSVFNSHSFGRNDPRLLDYWSQHPEILQAAMEQSNFQGAVSLSYTPVDYLGWSVGLGSPLGSSQIFSLLYLSLDMAPGVSAPVNSVSTCQKLSGSNASHDPVAANAS